MLFEDALHDTIKFEKPRMPSSIYKFGEENHHPKEKMKDAFEHGHFVSINDREWQSLKNSNSWSIKSLDDIKKQNIDFTREFNTLQKAIKYNNPIESPTVLQVENDQPYLLDGEIWLMCMKAMGIKPTVYWVNL